MDGEIDQESSRFLMRRLASDDEMKATWSRYHLVRDCLRFQDGTMADVDLTGRVSQALQAEATVHRRFAGASRWLKPVGGAAVAASVALMAVLAVGPSADRVNSGDAAGMTASSGVESFTSPQSILSPTPYSNQVNLSGDGSEDRQQMNAYLLRHYQAAGARGSHGVVTATPIILIGSNRAAERPPQKDEEPKPDEQ